MWPIYVIVDNEGMFQYRVSGWDSEREGVLGNEISQVLKKLAGNSN